MCHSDSPMRVELKRDEGAKNVPVIRPAKQERGTIMGITLQVGEIYDPDLLYETEGSVFNFGLDSHLLRIFRKEVSDAEAADVSSGKAQFGLFTAEQVIFFLSKFGSQPWQASAYCVWTVPSILQELQDVELPNRSTLHIHLVELSTGVLRAVRTLTLAPKFSQKLLREVYTQSFQQMTFTDYARGLDMAFVNNDAASMARKASVKCYGK